MVSDKQKSLRYTVFRMFLGIAAGLLLSGCAAFISTATQKTATNISRAILNNNDPAMVETGGPAYLLMIDGLLESTPDDEILLQTAATLYSAYTAGFVKDEGRAQKLTEKALAYGFHGLCVRSSKTCGFRKIGFDQFVTILNKMEKPDVPALYALGVAWAGWIESHKGDWKAIAELSRVEAIMQRVVAVDETYKDGGAHLYLGTFATLLPKTLGGKPETGRRHFERAIEIAKDKNLMIKVVFAKQYARLVFDRKLHDRLLQEVLSAEETVEGYTLINTLAKQQAQVLLKEADDYF